MTPEHCLWRTMRERFLTQWALYPDSVVSWMREQTSVDDDFAFSQLFYRSYRMPGNFSLRHSILSPKRAKLSPFLDNKFLDLSYRLPKAELLSLSVHRNVVAISNPQLLCHLSVPLATAVGTQDWFTRFQGGLGNKLREMLDHSLEHCSDVFIKDKMLELCDQNVAKPSRDIFFLFRVVPYALARRILSTGRPETLGKVEEAAIRVADNTRSKDKGCA